MEYNNLKVEKKDSEELLVGSYPRRSLNMKKIIFLSLVLAISLPLYAEKNYKFNVAEEVGDTKRNSLEEEEEVGGRDVASADDYYIDPDDEDLKRNPAALRKEKAKIRKNISIKEEQKKSRVQEWRVEKTFQGEGN
jgi:hypothetical protein